jgi:hypothetical protein
VIAADRLVLAPAEVQGNHQLTGDPLVGRICHRQPGQLTKHRGVPAARQRRIVTVQDRRQPLRVQSCPYLVEPRRIQGGERLATPQTQGLIQQRQSLPAVLGEIRPRPQVSERVQVHRQRVNPELITTMYVRDLHAPRRSQHPTQPDT